MLYVLRPHDDQWKDILACLESIDLDSGRPLQESEYEELRDLRGSLRVSFALAASPE